jgi:hypothetical protein
LDDGTFDVGEIIELRPRPIGHPNPQTGTFQYLKESDEALYLASYFKEGENHIGCGRRCDYRMSDSEMRFWSNAEFSGLTISQIFLFSRYANSPPHEPSETLLAARCHPMVKFEFVPSTTVDRTKMHYRVRSVRFDYRLHLFLDRHSDLKTNEADLQIGNQAGLFADNDMLSPAVLKHGVAGAIFAAVEKPLVLEVYAPGLAMGGSVYVDETNHGVWCWDNVHWWGARGKDKPMISSPGAFHAAHIHWRWGSVGQVLRDEFPTIDNPGTPRSVINETPISGALVDPKIWIQTIRVGVSKYERRLDPAFESVSLADLCRPDWKWLFINQRIQPDILDQGEDLVLWYSVEAYRELFIPSLVVDRASAPSLLPADPVVTRSRSYKWTGSGTVFLHGIFFAHNAEQVTKKTGDRWSQYWPNDRAQILKQRKWFRSG